MNNSAVSVSIVSHNSKNVLKGCIDSIIESAKGLKIEIILVDNCSQDGSAEFIKRHFPEVLLIENAKNVGFGTAHNQAFECSKGRYFLILNPDTIIFDHAINTLVEFMDSNDRAGVAGCKIFWDEEKNFMFPDLRIHSLITALIYFTPLCLFFPDNFLSRWYWRSAHSLWTAHTPVKVDGITGGLMMVRRELFASVRGFDGRFFLFFEEHDILRRIKQLGQEIYYVPSAEILHYFEESVRSSSIDVGAVFTQSALHYYKKHYGTLGSFFIKTLFALNSVCQRITLKSATGRQEYAKVYPENGRLSIRWQPQKGATRYLLEISYSPAFCDRGGVYVQGERFFLNSKVLKRLPNETGFVRVLPVYADNTTGKVVKVVKITGNGKDDRSPSLPAGR
jgi:GT2 family glycosyltransferase